MEELKRAAALRAVEWVQSGMVVGLGSGTTARHATLQIAARLRQGTLGDLVAVATSNETEALARAESIPLTTLDAHPRIDVTIDGADEVDPRLDLIKGRHGFLLREKIVAAASRQEIIVVDETKLVTRLGKRSWLPVEVVRFGWRSTEAAIARTGAETAPRMEGDRPFATDEGHCIIDCRWTEGIALPRELECVLHAIPGVVSTGLFLGIANVVIVAGAEGVRVLTR